MSDCKEIRIVDIAKMAGVSVGTVDRVIHNRGRVSAANYTRVMTVLKEVDYRPNMVARSLASKKVYHICFLLHFCPYMSALEWRIQYQSLFIDIILYCLIKIFQTNIYMIVGSIS